MVALILPDTFPFAGTLAYDLRYGRRKTTDEEVVRVADAASVTEFAQDLPDGPDSQIPTGGIGLSGGQRQRVEIALALFVNSRVVVLDARLPPQHKVAQATR